jgi:hypothetical protein
MVLAHSWITLPLFLNITNIHHTMQPFALPLAASQEPQPREGTGTVTIVPHLHKRLVAHIVCLM